LAQVQGQKLRGMAEQEIANNKMKMDLMAAQYAQKGKFSMKEIGQLDTGQNAVNAAEQLITATKQGGVGGSKLASNVPLTQNQYGRLREKLLTEWSSFESPTGRPNAEVRKQLERELPPLFAGKEKTLQILEDIHGRLSNRLERYKTAKPAGGSQLEEGTSEGM
jgi:hypothetical protein